MTRRDFLRACGLTLGGVALMRFAPLRAYAVAPALVAVPAAASAVGITDTAIVGAFAAACTAITGFSIAKYIGKPLNDTTTWGDDDFSKWNDVWDRFHNPNYDGENDKVIGWEPNGEPIFDRDKFNTLVDTVTRWNLAHPDKKVQSPKDYMPNDDKPHKEGRALKDWALCVGISAGGSIAAGVLEDLANDLINSVLGLTKKQKQAATLVFDGNEYPVFNASGSKYWQRANDYAANHLPGYFCIAQPFSQYSDGVTDVGEQDDFYVYANGAFTLKKNAYRTSAGAYPQSGTEIVGVAPNGYATRIGGDTCEVTTTSHKNGSGGNYVLTPSGASHVLPSYEPGSSYAYAPVEYPAENVPVELPQQLAELYEMQQSTPDYETNEEYGKKAGAYVRSITRSGQASNQYTTFVVPYAAVNGQTQPTEYVYPNTTEAVQPSAEVRTQTITDTQTQPDLAQDNPWATITLPDGYSFPNSWTDGSVSAMELWPLCYLGDGYKLYQKALPQDVQYSDSVTLDVPESLYKPGTNGGTTPMVLDFSPLEPYRPMLRTIGTIGVLAGFSFFLYRLWSHSVDKTDGGD